MPSDLCLDVMKFSEANLAGDKLRPFLREQSFAASTKHIKNLFGNLGKERDCKVCASGCDYTDGTAWLYDLLWFKEADKSDGRLFRRQILALESENIPGGSVQRAADVDGDFCKLVQARVDLRVWFAAIPNDEMARQHLKNCEKQARLFDGSLPGDEYVMIIYSWRSDRASVTSLTI